MHNLVSILNSLKQIQRKKNEDSFQKLLFPHCHKLWWELLPAIFRQVSGTYDKPLWNTQIACPANFSALFSSHIVQCKLHLRLYIKHKRKMLPNKNVGNGKTTTPASIIPDTLRFWPFLNGKWWEGRERESRLPKNLMQTNDTTSFSTLHSTHTHTQACNPTHTHERKSWPIAGTSR